MTPRPAALVVVLTLGNLISCGLDPQEVPSRLASEEAGALEASAAALQGQELTLSFHGDYSHALSEPLEAGGKLRVPYDASRLPQCRGEQDGQPAWSITGYYRLGEGPVGSFEAGGYSPSNGTQAPVIELATAGELAIWFQVSNRWGCVAWDSRYGQNYRFTVDAQPTLRFREDGSTRVEGRPSPGAPLVVSYDLARLPRCRATYNGLPAWEVLAYYRFDGGQVRYQVLTALEGSARVAAPAVLDVPSGAKSLELWIKNSDRAGCVAYDSKYGANHHFSLR